MFIETKNYHYKSILFIVLSIQDLCDIEDELETKLGVFKVHINGKKKEKKKLENPGIDPGTSRMLSERSTI